MSVVAHLLTAEEFAALPGSRYQELVRGEIVEHMPPGRQHGKLALKIGKLIDNWIERDVGGEVGVEAGFILARDPDLVRSPDVYYIRPERLPEGEVSESFWPIAPDLAVEVVSPHDSANEIETKVGEYLAAGTAQVWVIYPRSQRVVVHTPDGLARTYGPEATLVCPELLPGFTLVIKDLFA